MLTEERGKEGKVQSYIFQVVLKWRAVVVDQTRFHRYHGFDFAGRASYSTLPSLDNAPLF
jgi:hypothetical protein